MKSFFDNVLETPLNQDKKTTTENKARLAVCKIIQCQSKQSVGCGVLVYDQHVEDSELMSKYIIITSSKVIQEESYAVGDYEVKFTKKCGNTKEKEKHFDLKNVTKSVRHVASGQVVIIFIESNYSGLKHRKCTKCTKCSILGKSPLTIADYDQRQQPFCYIGNQCYIVEFNDESRKHVLKAVRDESDTTANSFNAPDEIPNGTVILQLQGADKNVKAVGILNVVDVKQMVISPVWLKAGNAAILDGVTMPDDTLSGNQEPPVAPTDASNGQKPPDNVNGEKSTDGVTVAGHTSPSGNQEPPVAPTDASNGQKPLDNVNSEMSTNGVTMADHTSPSSNQEPPVTSTDASNGQKPPDKVNSEMSTDGVTTAGHISPSGNQEPPVAPTDASNGQKPPDNVNSEMSTDGVTMADHTSPSSNQEPPVAFADASDGEPPNNVNSEMPTDDVRTADHTSPSGNQEPPVAPTNASNGQEPPDNVNSEKSTDSVTMADHASPSSDQELPVAPANASDGEPSDYVNGSSNGERMSTPPAVQDTGPFTLDSPVQEILEVKPECLKPFYQHMDEENMFGNGWKRFYKELKLPAGKESTMAGREGGPTFNCIKGWISKEGRNATVRALLAAVNCAERKDCCYDLEKSLGCRLDYVDSGVDDITSKMESMNPSKEKTVKFFGDLDKEEARNVEKALRQASALTLLEDELKKDLGTEKLLSTTDLMQQSRQYPIRRFTDSLKDGTLRENVVKTLRSALSTYEGVTGPSLPPDTYFQKVGFTVQNEVAKALSGDDSWKVVAERLGTKNVDIKYHDNRSKNPAEEVLRIWGHKSRSTVGALYDILVELGYPCIADLL